MLKKIDNGQQLGFDTRKAWTEANLDRNLQVQQHLSLPAICEVLGAHGVIPEELAQNWRDQQTMQKPLDSTALKCACYPDRHLLAAR